MCCDCILFTIYLFVQDQQPLSHSNTFPHSLFISQFQIFTMVMVSYRIAGIFRGAISHNFGYFVEKISWSGAHTIRSRFDWRFSVGKYFVVSHWTTKTTKILPPPFPPSPPPPPPQKNTRYMIFRDHPNTSTSFSVQFYIMSDM